MTAFQASDIPANIDTMEELALWAVLALYDLNKGSGYKEAEGTTISSGLAPVVDFSMITAADNTQRAICRLAVELNASWLSDASLPLWAFAQPMSTAPLPAAYKAA